MDPAICRACLSGGRKLVGLDCVRNIIEGIHLNELLHLTGSVCWECRSIMVKFYKFKFKVCLAQKLITQFNKKNLNLKSLSSLTTITYAESCVNEQNNEYTNKTLQDLDTRTIEPEFVDNTYNSDNKIKDEVDTANNFYSSEVIQDGVDLTTLNNEIKSEAEIGGNFDYSEVIQDEVDCQNVIGKDIIVNKNLDVVVKNNLNTPIGKTASESSKNIFKDKIVTMVLKRKELEKRRECLMLKLSKIDSKFKCVGCILGFDDQAMFDDHFSRYHDERLGCYSCEFCHRRFPSEIQMHLHNSDHFNYYKCKLCDFESDIFFNVTSHYSDTHSGETEVVDDPEKKFKCEECGATYLKYNQLSRHRRRHRTPQYSCHLCHKKYHVYCELSYHVQQTHEGLPKLKCDICDKYYKGKVSLNAHIKSQHNNTNQDESAFCVECNKQFKNINQFKQHIRHTVKHINHDARLQCDICKKSFTLRASLIEHIKNLHENNRLETCQECNKTFKTQKNLKRHIVVVHKMSEKQKRYVCDICGNSYKHPLSLREHMNTHSNSRPYECELCGARFNHSGSMYTHKQLVHNKIKRKKILPE